MPGRAPLFHCPAQTTVLLRRFFKECKVPVQKRQIRFLCQDVHPLFQSLSHIQKSLAELGCLDLLGKCWLNSHFSLGKKSAFSNVHLHSVSVVLHVASISKSTFYERFISVEKNHILGDQILDYLPLLLNASKQTSWNLKKFLVP